MFRECRCNACCMLNAQNASTNQRINAHLFEAWGFDSTGRECPSWHVYSGWTNYGSSLGFLSVERCIDTPETSRNHWYTIGFNHWFLMILMVSRFVFSQCFGSSPGFFVAGVVCGSRRWHQQQRWRWSTWTWDAGRLWYREHGSAGWRSLEIPGESNALQLRPVQNIEFFKLYIYNRHI